MPWKDMCAMEQREEFVEEWLKRESSLSQLCRSYGVSRKTGHKWLRRFREEGREGLEEHSRSTLRHPNATPPAIEERLVAYRRKRPDWGPRKLLDRLQKQEPTITWPAASTAGAILKRHGLVRPRRWRRAPVRHPTFLRPADAPNDVWAADFKGWFRTGDGKRMDPLTVSDCASRYLLLCEGLPPTGIQVKARFERIFQDYGLPRAIRTDNGPPFASAGLCGLSWLSVWWIRLGITPERIRPGHPEENGRHERMHRTLKQATATPPERTWQAQQASFDTFRSIYNDERPHEALAMNTPVEVYRRSDRCFPRTLPQIEYPDDMALRRVRPTGEIKWEGHSIFISEALRGEVVGLQLSDNDTWTVHFGSLTIASLQSTKTHFRLSTAALQVKKV
jgi:putative transposase